METWKPSIAKFNDSSSWHVGIKKDSDDFNLYGKDPHTHYPWVYVDGAWYLTEEVFWQAPRAVCDPPYLICIDGQCWETNPGISPPGLPGVYPPPARPPCGKTITIGGIEYSGPPCPEGCATSSSLTVSIPDATISIGTTATASGGLGPYSFSISVGSIDSSGVITATSCGTAVITVTDACGKTAQCKGKMPAGVYVPTVLFSGALGGCGYDCYNQFSQRNGSEYGTGASMPLGGTYQYVYYYKYGWRPTNGGCPPTSYTAYGGQNPPCDTGRFPSTLFGCTSVVQYDWRCL